MGAGANVDNPEFVEKGIDEAGAGDLVKRAEGIIERAGEEYKAVFLSEYKRLMTARLGLKSQQDSDFDTLFSELLDILEAYELDFHHAFRKLSSLSLAVLEDEGGGKTQQISSSVTITCQRTMQNRGSGLRNGLRSGRPELRKTGVRTTTGGKRL